MKENKEAKISYWAAHLTTIVSVTLVLIIVGLIALITISAAGETRRLRSSLEVSVVMADSVSDSQAASLAEEIKQTPYAHEVRVITRQQALDAWKADTGEDLEALFGVNPLSPEVCFSVTPEYSTMAALGDMEAELSRKPGVDAVAVPDSHMVDAMNDNIGKLAVILGIIAVVMLIISFVLINNTVHLSIYSRRFTIHTMQLVGATNGFIRRPFILNNTLSGIISGLLAGAVLGAAVAIAPRAGYDDVTSLITWPAYACVALSVVALGALLCSVAAWIATSRYLGKDYDELFR